MKMNNKKRFTLIELIIVIVVIGILAGMALPKFMGVTRDAKAANLKNDADVLQTVAALLETENDGTGNLYGAKDGALEETITIGTETYTVLELDETAYKAKLSKLPKMGAITDFKVIVDGDKTGSIIYDVVEKDDAGVEVVDGEQVGVTDGSGVTWYGVEINDAPEEPVNP